METKGNRINKTMESLDGVNRAEADPLLFEKIMQGTPHHKTVPIQSRKILSWRVAALILILISFNVFTLVYYTGNLVNSQNEVRSVADEYFSYIDTINL